MLTHTDHKPYECGTCGKVFRRNCDLRRHALTHTIGGDMPTELAESGNDSANEKITIDDENDDANELEDEFDDIQVDSPVNERNTPSPGMPDDKEVGDDEENNESVKEIRHGEDELDGEPPRKMPRLEQQPKDDGELPGITHCHHNGGQTHYTMRPQQVSSGLASDGKLHVRRDLHYKVDTSTTIIHHRTTITVHSSSNNTPATATSNSSSSIASAPVPFRKRSAGLNYENTETDALASSSHHVPLHTSPLNLSNHTSTARNQETSNGKPSKIEIQSISTILFQFILFQQLRSHHSSHHHNQLQLQLHLAVPASASRT